VRTSTFTGETPTVDAAAFAECDGLHVVAFKDVSPLARQIASEAFPSCDVLSLDEFQTQTVDGVLFSADGKTLLASLEPKTEYVVPDGVATIAAKAFYNARTLRSIAFQNGLQAVGDAAFFGCDALESVEFPSGLESIGDNAFNGCRSLRSATLPDGALWFAFHTFFNCASDLTVYVPSGSDAEKRAATYRLRFETR